MAKFVSNAVKTGTRLSRWHSYPAMVPDVLAAALSGTHVWPGARVLDPFCGSGRLLMAAAACGAECVGMDVNPLACLLTRAKAADACLNTITSIADEAALRRVARQTCAPLVLRIPTTVEWFSKDVAAELAEIIKWINSLCLGQAERYVVGAALSAAVRDVSWIRKGGWKLHRLGTQERKMQTKSAWDRFAERLQYYVTTAPRVPLLGSISVTTNDARALSCDDMCKDSSKRFDVALTSPPYGDSKTTVHYGGASAILLDVVSRIDGLEDLFLSGRAIDSACLGSRQSAFPREPVAADLHRYWAGSRRSSGAYRVELFLADFAEACRGIASVLTPSGRAVLVVGRRSVSGFRVKLDDFSVDQFDRHGMRLLSSERRKLKGKRLPAQINRYARAKSSELRSRGATKTIGEEIILVFGRTPEPGQ